MAISRDSTLDLNQIGTRVRLLTGIEATEVDDTDLSELVSMAIEWVEDQLGSTYTVDRRFVCIFCRRRTIQKI